MADWKSIGAGLGAGLQPFGAGYGREREKEEVLKQQQQENNRAEEKLTETKRMNDALLAQRAQTAKQAKFEFGLKQAAETHKQMSSGIAAAGFSIVNWTTMAKIASKVGVAD